MNGNTMLVAVADDHAIVRKGIIELINNFGDFTVIIEATNGQQLVDSLQSATQLPDVCLLDINMPGLNGYDTAALIKKEWPDIKILALSMYDKEFSIIKMLRNGANGYILKGMEPAELKDALLQVHKQNYYHSDLVSGRLINAIHADKKSKFNLSQKEMDFLSYCCTDLTYKEIGVKMELSQRTIEGYRDALLEKLNIKSRSGLVVFAISIGLLPKSY